MHNKGNSSSLLNSMVLLLRSRGPQNPAGPIQFMGLVGQHSAYRTYPLEKLPSSILCAKGFSVHQSLQKLS